MPEITLADTQTANSNTGTISTVLTHNPPVPQLNLFTNFAAPFGLVIVLILVLAWIVKRTHLKRYTSSLIRVKTNYPLSSKERIIVLEVDNKLLVVGVTPQQMTLLHTIDAQHSAELLAAEQPMPSSSSNSLFQQLLTASLKRKK